MNDQMTNNLQLPRKPDSPKLTCNALEVDDFTPQEISWSWWHLLELSGLLKSPDIGKGTHITETGAKMNPGQGVVLWADTPMMPWYPPCRKPQRSLSWRCHCRQTQFPYFSHIFGVSTKRAFCLLEAEQAKNFQKIGHRRLFLNPRAPRNQGQPSLSAAHHWDTSQCMRNSQLQPGSVAAPQLWGKTSFVWPCTRSFFFFNSHRSAP